MLRAEGATVGGEHGWRGRQEPTVWSDQAAVRAAKAASSAAPSSAVW